LYPQRDGFVQESSAGLQQRSGSPTVPEPQTPLAPQVQGICSAPHAPESVVVTSALLAPSTGASPSALTSELVASALTSAFASTLTSVPVASAGVTDRSREASCFAASVSVMTSWYGPSPFDASKASAVRESVAASMISPLTQIPVTSGVPQ
jgi:hypothetical protein